MRFPPTSIAFRTRGVAVDLGTANTVLCARGGELVVLEPSVIAADAHTGEPLAAGSDAVDLFGREGVAAIRPLKAGVIADLPATEELLRHLISRVRRRGRPPRVVASVPTGVSDVQRRAVAQACVAAGAREVRLIAKPIAAALGSGLPVEEPIGSMVLDIGAGTSEVAVISMGAIVASRLIPVGGHDLDERILSHLKREHAVVVGRRTAEQIKLQIGSAARHGQGPHVETLGRDMASECLRTVTLTSQEIRCALERPLTWIIEATREILRSTPPQLACDVMDRGITLTGGGALLHGLADRLRLATGIPARLADGPSTCVAIGAMRLVDSGPTRSQSPAPRALVATPAAASK